MDELGNAESVNIKIARSRPNGMDTYVDSSIKPFYQLPEAEE